MKPLLPTFNTLFLHWIIVSVFTVILSNHLIQAQALILKIKDPTGITLCRDAETTLSLLNTTGNAITNIQVKLILPSGMQYIPGSVNGAQEQNIQQLTQPEFLLANLNRNDSTKIRLKFIAGCQLYDKGNMTMTFANKWIVNYGTLKDSVESFPEFQLLTPLLLIHKLNDTTVLTGSTFNRRISITNTRLGSLSRFTYENHHDCLDISSNSGTVLSTTDTLLRIEFGPSDFLKIGNRDSLFDKDETIEILELVKDTDCKLKQIRSDYLIYWGCNTDTCKVKSEYNITTFTRSNELADLRFSRERNFPSCICDSIGTPQCLIITNTGKQIAENIEITLKATDILDMNPYGIVMGSVIISGAAQLLDIQYLHKVNVSNCTTDQMYAYVIIRLTELAPGKEVKIQFNYSTCLVSPPTTGNLLWYYAYSFNSKCVPNSTVSSAIDIRVEMINPGNLLTSRSAIKDGAGILENNKSYVVQNILKLSKKTTNQWLYITYTIPCPLRLSETEFLLDGKAPIEKTIQEIDSTIFVNLVYEPPFNDSLILEYKIKVDCDFLCNANINKARNTYFISSCPNFQFLLANLSALICIDAQLSCPGRKYDCGPYARSQTGFELQCVNLPSRRDSIHSYLEGDARSYRYNFGGADPDDDRLLNSGVLDTSQARQKKFITSDWIAHDYETSVIISNDRFYYDSVAFMISASPELSYDSVFSDILIRDISTGISYSARYPISSLYISNNGIPNCAFIVVSRSGFGNGLIIPLTVEQLNQYGAHIPSGFQFEEGDSIYAKIYCRIGSYVADRVQDIRLSYRAFFIDRQNRIPDPFSCMLAKDTIQLATQGLQFTQSQDTIFVCKSNFEIHEAILKGTSSLENYFNNEYRVHYSLDSIKIFVSPFNPNLIIDSIQLEYFYEHNGVENRIHAEKYPARLRNNQWELDPDILRNHMYDESYSIRIKPQAYLKDCDQFKNTKSNLISVYFVNAKNRSVFYDIGNSNNMLKNIFYSSANTLHVYNGNEQINIPNKTINSSTTKIQWKALVSNLRVDGGFNFEILSKNKSIRNLNLQTSPLVLIKKHDSLNLSADIFRKNGNYILDFTADHFYCSRDTILLISRWYCKGDTSTILDKCSVDTFSLIILPEFPELELFVDTLTASEFVLCDTLPELNLELYNADKGTAYDVHLDIALPQGVEFIASTLFYSYPKGSPLKPLPVPIRLGPNSYRWFFSDLIPEIQMNGLPGIKLPPDNSNVIQIKMKLITYCNASVNNYPRFFISGKNHCGDPSNSILKPGPLIKIKGIPLPGTFNLSIQSPDFDCIEEAELRIALHKKGLTTLSDSLKINLPSGLFYLPNSLRVIRNLSNDEPKVIIENGLQTLFFGILPGLNQNDSILFTIRAGGLSSIRCNEAKIQVSTFTKNTSYCSVLMKACDVYVESGFTELTLQQTTGSMHLDSFKIMNSVDSSKHVVLFTYSILDKDHFKEDNICIGLFEDINKNGALDSQDIVMDTLMVDLTKIQVNGQYNFEKIVDNHLLQSCHYLLATLPKNCLCQADTLFYSFTKTLHVYKYDSLCPGDSILIGTNRVSGKNYLWIKGELDCDTCLYNQIRFDTTNSEDTILSFTLRETDSSACDKHYHFRIKVRPNPSGTYYTYESCPGEIIQINAGSRMSYVWIGDSILNPLSYQQRFVNFKERTIYLNFKDKNNCPSHDTFLIRPLIDTTEIILSGDSIVVLGKPVRYCIKGGKVFHWTPESSFDCPDCPCVVINPEITAWYSVTVLDSFDCPHTFNFKILVTIPSCDSSNIFLPNAFSPNGDSKNDILFVRGTNIERMHLGIYNRWGQKVFESFDQQNGWDGTFNGSLLTPDVFGYHLEVDCIGGSKYFKKGNISIVK
jgi:gliding motility-associated-like protein